MMKLFISMPELPHLKSIKYIHLIQRDEYLHYKSLSIQAKLWQHEFHNEGYTAKI
jgi:hypothetical protein